MNPKNLATRRNALKGIGATALAAAGLGAASLSASADAVINIDISGTQISNDQGDVSWVGVQADKEIDWDGFDVPVTHIGFKHEITLDDGDATPWHEVYPHQISDPLSDWSGNGDSNGWGGAGEYVEEYTGDKGVDGLDGIAHADVKWAIISDGTHPSEWDSVQDPIDWTSTLSVDTDGSDATHKVLMRSTITFYSGTDESDNPVQITQDEGVPEVVGTDSFDVAVFNEGGTTEGSTSIGSADGA